MNESRRTLFTRVLDMIPKAHRALVVIALAVLAIVYVALQGCASLTAPKTPAQQLAYVDATFTSLVETAADLRASGAIDAGQAAEIDPLIERGDRTLDAAWAALEAGNPDTALEYLDTVNRLIPQLRQAVEERSDEPDETGGSAVRDREPHDPGGTRHARRAGGLEPGLAGAGRRAGSHRYRDRAAAGGPGAGAGALGIA